MLYALLVEGRARSAASSAATTSRDHEVRDTDGDGLPEFVDAWGEPLQFYRWPIAHRSRPRRQAATPSYSGRSRPRRAATRSTRTASSWRLSWWSADNSSPASVTPSTKSRHRPATFFVPPGRSRTGRPAVRAPPRMLGPLRGIRPAGLSLEVPDRLGRAPTARSVSPRLTDYLQVRARYRRDDHAGDRRPGRRRQRGLHLRRPARAGLRTPLVVGPDRGAGELPSWAIDPYDPLARHGLHRRRHHEPGTPEPGRRVPMTTRRPVPAPIDRPRPRVRGFTLIELLVVILIIVLISRRRCRRSSRR